MKHIKRVYFYLKERIHNSYFHKINNTSPQNINYFLKIKNVYILHSKKIFIIFKC